MSSLICFPKQMSEAWQGERGGEGGPLGSDSMAASVSVDPGNQADGDSFGVSEDLGCTSEVRGVTEADRGSDSQRDAAERLAEPSLIRSTAVEDLTSIGDIKEEDAPEAPPILSLAQSGFDSSSAGLCRGNSSESLDPCANLPCDPGAENSHDSWQHRAGYSEPSDDSEGRAPGAAQLHKPPSTRKSLVPVAVSKGLFALYPHRSSSASSSHFFGSFCSLICSTLSPR